MGSTRSFARELEFRRERGRANGLGNRTRSQPLCSVLMQLHGNEFNAVFICVSTTSSCNRFEQGFFRFLMNRTMFSKTQCSHSCREKSLEKNEKRLHANSERRIPARKAIARLATIILSLLTAESYGTRKDRQLIIVDRTCRITAVTLFTSANIQKFLGGLES